MAPLDRPVIAALLLAVLGALPSSARGQSLDPPPLGHVPQTEMEVVLTRTFADYGVAVVGGELITDKDIVGLLQEGRGLKEDPTEGREDLSPLERRNMRYSAALEQIVDRQLKTRGGRNQGYGAELIAAQKSAWLDDFVQRQGGEVWASQRIAALGFTPETYKEYVGELFYAQLWESSLTGKAPGASGRKIVDDYVRPGQMYETYGGMVRSPRPEHQELVGRSPAKVTFARLIIPVPSVAETRETQANAETYRDNVARGIVEFDQLIALYGARNFRNDNARETVAVDQLDRYLRRTHPGSPDDVQAFLGDLEPGTLSQVLALQSGANIDGYVIYRIEEVLPERSATPFVDLELQSRLLGDITERTAEVRVWRGLAQLALTTHVEPPQLKQGLIRRGARRLNPDRE